MSEEVTVARIEQQLKDAVVNQEQIIEDLRTIFNRIDRESKIIALIRSDLKSHLDTSVVKGDELNSRFKFIEERHIDLKDSYTKFKDKVSDEIEKVKGVDKVDGVDIKRQIRDINDKVEKNSQDYTTFKTEINTSMRVTKWVFGGIISLGTLTVAIIKIMEFLKSLNFKAQ